MEVNNLVKVLKKVNGLQLNDHIILWNDFSVYDMKSGETVEHENIESVLKDDAIKKLIDEYDGIIHLNGGRGAAGGKTLFSIDETKGGKSIYDIPAKMNRMYDGNKKSIDNALSDFQKKHLNSKSESAILTDEDGFVSVYKHGGKSSVGFDPAELKDKTIIHNHPSHGWGNFSGNDIVTMATTGAKGVIATGGKGTFKLMANGNANPQGIVRALKNAYSTDSNYDRATDRWLKRYAKKYGYTYSTVNFNYQTDLGI